MNMMSSDAATTAAIATTVAAQASSYRVKFKREQFLESVELARPAIIYRRGNNHFFAFGGFVVYCQQCNNEDFPKQRVIEAIELSNNAWST
jgi:hypothetical protein